MNNKIAYLFLNGELFGDPAFYLNYINNNKGHIFCADGGFKHCLSLNLTPLEVWGDLDSLSPHQITILENSNVVLKRFPPNKDFTDGELVIEYLSTLYDKIVIIGGLGGKFAHTLTNLSLLAKFKNCEFFTNNEKIFVVPNNHVLNNLKGATISFVPLAQTVENLTFTGFQYELSNYNLTLGESICMSNIITSNSATIQYSNGVLLGILDL